jgi:hypothetical protein
MGWTNANFDWYRCELELSLLEVTLAGFDEPFLIVPGMVVDWVDDVVYWKAETHRPNYAA